MNVLPFYYPCELLPMQHDSGVFSFDVDACEQCGAIVVALNPVIVVGPAAEHLEHFGAKKMMPPEHTIGFCSVLDKAVCSNCYRVTPPRQSEDEV